MQQINHTICQEQEQIMVYLIFDIKDQNVWNSFGKIMKSCSLKKIKETVKDDILSKLILNPDFVLVM